MRLGAHTGFMKTKTTFLVLLLGACAGSGLAQNFDSSGDSKLNGTYYFRQVLYFEEDAAGDLQDAMSLQGTITFNGAGAYTTNATLLDGASGSSTPQSFTGSGTYVISASGEGYISAVNPDFTGDQIVGLVSSEGVFIGSTTETTEEYNDLFVAAPVGSQSNGTLSGSYQAAYFDPTYTASNGVPGGDALLTFTANGSGGIGSLNASEYLGGNTSATAQNLSGVTYSFSNGAAQLNFGGSNTTNLIGGTDLLYSTPDGNFIFGGNYNGFDMFVGVKNATSNPSSYQALYYQAGVDLDLYGYPNSNDGLDSYYGATNIFSGEGVNNIIADERDNLPAAGATESLDYYDQYTLNGDGSASDSYYTYWTSPDGAIRVGFGPSAYLGINVAFQAPSFSGSGVYIDPVGVENAASSAPFTAFLSPGEFVSIYGSGLADTTTSSGLPFPTSGGLAGVTVTVNDVQAPVYFVSPNQISFIVPWATTQEVAQIQVNNNGSNSNTVTAFVGETSVGVFTNTPVGGDGTAAAERPDYSVVSASNPAQVGETVAMYVGGMGGVSNQPADGAAASSTVLSYTDATPVVTLYDDTGNSASATVAFSGLAPGFAGLYQINFTVPSGLDYSDPLSVDLWSGVDSENFEAILPVTDTSSAIPAARSAAGSRPHLHRRRSAKFRAPRQSAAKLRRGPGAGTIVPQP